MQTFHNTISLRGEDLKQAVARAAKQEEAIRLIYLHTRQKFTAGDIHKLMIKAGYNHPLTSTRRAISNLFKANELVKLSEQKKGDYDVVETFYRLNFFKYPTKQGEQQGLFQ